MAIGRKLLLWMAAVVVVILVGVGGVVAVGLTIFGGFSAAIETCGIDYFKSGGGTQPASLVTPSPTPSPSPSLTEGAPLIASPSPSPTATPVELGSAAKAYLAQFSSAQQEEKKKHAALIVSIGSQTDGVTQHDMEAAVGVSLQESGLINLLIAYDHDSLGIFQQRPSVGTWGTAQEIIDPVHATNKFLEKLLTIPAAERAKMPLKEIGIRVQIPNRYYYDRDWRWDQIAKEFVATYLSKSPGDSASICLEAAGVATGEWQLPLVEGSYCPKEGFGPRPDAGKPGGIGMHNGIDLSCNAGDPIYAVADGTVKIAGPNGGYGNNVRIDHGGGIDSSYGHMLWGSIPPGVVKGATVKRGQIIGYVGNTGRSFGAHLHFEIIRDDRYTDPEKFMSEQGVSLR